MAELIPEEDRRLVALPQLAVEAITERLFRFRCVGCGYGASCKIAPERCPMCTGQIWEHEERKWSGRGGEFRV
jgi:rubrerythrin